MPTAQEIYASTIRGLPPDERLQLAALIVNELAKAGAAKLNISDAWSEEDMRDLANFSMQYADATERTSLRGIWKGLDITDEDIENVREDMWGKFPRKDV